MGSSFSFKVEGRLCTLLLAAMLSTVSRSAVRTPAVRAFAAVPSPWGSDAWRYDKNAFQAWAHEAVTKKGSQAQRELYGMLAMRFGDTDVDKDGKISAAEFDTLCEDVASLPRRFGLAPSWEKEYGNIERRTASRKAMFDMIDLRQGPARHWIGLEQFVRWSFDHVVTKAASIDASAEVDSRSAGVLNFKEFDALLSRAAQVPRTFGLAPPDASAEFRKAAFEKMEDKAMGGVTFRRLVEWTVEHTKGKIADQKAGKGYKK